MDGYTPENRQSLTYVVSSDVEVLTRRWARETGIVIPDPDFFAEQEHRLAANLGNFTKAPIEVIPSKYLIDSIGRYVAETGVEVISMDRAYVNGHVTSFIDTTRAVDSNLEKIGLVNRPGTADIDRQIKDFGTTSKTPACLVDDVIFSGECVVDIMRRLEAAKRPVTKVIAGIAIREGLTAIEEYADSQNRTIEVVCVEQYDEVMDEVCERDFIAGSPMSGRTLIAEDGSNWSAPYFPHFGNADWASIPTDAVPEFASFAYNLSATYWKELEVLNGRPISGSEVPRPIRQLFQTASFATALKELANQ